MRRTGVLLGTPRTDGEQANACAKGGTHGQVQDVATYTVRVAGDVVEVEI
jgi:hypothetical protein